ncbi:MAG: hypothetical protein KJ645_03450 [Planctomycetes bacterium]|nr:hypothetical protein [Planctomycetota bacterium]
MRLQFFKKSLNARFLTRPDRFTLFCELAGKRVKAYLPNPGRLHELLRPGVPLSLIPTEGSNRSTAYTVVAVHKGGVPVMLHTHLTNDVAGYILRISQGIL